jgi:hypothetical protein
MADARTPQDRKPPAAKKAAAASRVAAVSQAAASRSGGKGPSARRKDVDAGPELAAEAQPVEAPEGCPPFKLLAECSRRERAAYLRALDVVTSKVRVNEDLQALDDTDPAAAERKLQARGSVIKVTADLAEMAADVEDVLKIVAVDQHAFAGWASKASDEALLQAFSWYQATAAPGEI